MVGLEVDTPIEKTRVKFEDHELFLISLLNKMGAYVVDYGGILCLGVGKGGFLGRNFVDVGFDEGIACACTRRKSFAMAFP